MSAQRMAGPGVQRDLEAHQARRQRGAREATRARERGVGRGGERRAPGAAAVPVVVVPAGPPCVVLVVVPFALTVIVPVISAPWTVQ